MRVFKSWLLVALWFSTVAGAATSSQETIRRLLHQRAPTALVIQEIDALISDKPTCETAEFLVELLTTEPPDERVLLRVARRLAAFQCADPQHSEHLMSVLRLRGAELGVLDAILRLVGAPKPTATDHPLARPPRLFTRTGFQAFGGLRASLSPSGRYLATGSMRNGGSIEVWDLYTGYRQRTLEEPMTFLSAFLSERYLIVGSITGILLWDLRTGQERYLLTRFFPETITFLELSPDRRLLAWNSRGRGLEIYRVEGMTGEADAIHLEKQYGLEGARVQSGVFASNGHLLLGTEDWHLLNLDIERREVAAQAYLGNPEDLSTDVNGDFAGEALRVLERGFQGIREIAVSADGRHAAAVTNHRVVVLRITATELTQEFVLDLQPSFKHVLFVGGELVAWNRSVCSVIAVGEPGHPARAGPDEVKSAVYGVVLAGSTALFAGTEDYTIFDFVRRLGYPRRKERSDIDAALHSWLLEDGRLLTYSVENGLRETNLWELEAAVDGSEPFFPLTLYRGGLLGNAPPKDLVALGTYRDQIFWVEMHNIPYLVVLSPPTGKGNRLVSIRPLPASFKQFPAEMETSEAFDQKLRSFRKLRFNYPIEISIDFGGISQDLIPDILLAIKAPQRVAFNGGDAAFATEQGVTVLPAGQGEAWTIPEPDSYSLVAFHPKQQNHLVVWTQGGSLEGWDVAARRKLWVLPLPSLKPRLMRFDLSANRLALATRNQVLVIDQIESETSAAKIGFSRDFGPSSNIFGLAFDETSSRLLISGIGLGETDLAIADLRSLAVQTFQIGGTFGFLSEALFWPDQRHIVEKNLGSTLGLYRAGTEGVDKSLDLVFPDDGEAVLFDPTNRFWATLEGIRDVGIDYGSHARGVEELARGGQSDPMAILAALRGALPPSPPGSPAEPPQIFLLDDTVSPFSQRTLDEANALELRFEVQGSVSVAEVVVEVNGVRKFSVPVNAKSRQLPIKLANLDYGHSVVSFIAVDIDGNTSMRTTVPVFVRSSDRRPPRLLFVGIGADRGSAAERPLPYPHRDALFLAGLFKEMSLGEYWSEIESRVLEPSELTPAGIRDAFNKARGKLGHRDLLVVYLAGHGVRDTKGSYSFLTAGGSISFDELGQFLERIDSRILILLDTCSSGQVVTETVASRLLKRSTGVAVFAASKSWQETYAWDDLQHSNLAAALARGFARATDLDGNSVISLWEFAKVVAAEAEELAREQTEKRIALLRNLVNTGAFALETRGPGKLVIEGHDEEFWRFIRYPHQPWTYGLDMLGDIPLIPLFP